MKDLKNKLDKKTKGEQIFIMILMFVALTGVFCIVGCGGKKSCESPKCGKEDFYGGTATGCSVPGCGGCLTPEKGCDTACWPQSCKYVVASVELEDESENWDELESESEDYAIVKISACDTRYYGDGCGGCAQREKTCYTGCLSSENGDDDKIKGIFYGSTGKEEKFIGCANGCGGCVGSEYGGAVIIDEAEKATGVN